MCQRCVHNGADRMMAKRYFQCRLRLGTLETTGWIEARGAKAGAKVELLPSRQLWDIAAVYECCSLSEEYLKELQGLHRHSLPSIEPMA